MYKLVIVDDEERIRKGLKNIIRWDEMDVEVVGEASDGEEAIEVVAKLKPDIIISDIKMPGLSGLEFIKDLRGKLVKTKIIIISGYSDFTYAQQAIKLDVNDYILKPIDEDELVEIVKQCVKDLDEETRIKEDKLKIRSIILNRRKHFFNELLSNKQLPYAEIEKNYKMLDIPIPLSGILTVVYKLTPLAGLEDYFFSFEEELIEFSALNIIGEMFDQVSKTLLFSKKFNEIILLISMDNKNEAVFNSEIDKILEMSLISLQKFFKCNVVIGVGTVNDVTGISEGYQKAAIALEGRLIDGLNRIYHFNETGDKSDINIFKEQQEIKLLNHIKCGDDQSITRIVNDIFHYVRQNLDNICPQYLKNQIIGLVRMIYNNIEIDFKSQKRNEQAWSNFEEIEERISETNSLDELQSTVEHQMLAFSLKYNERVNISGNRKTINNAIVFMQQHYSEQLTMNDVAGHVYLHPNYFSALFTAITGEQYSKCLVNIRLKKAKELMRDQHLKIYEIANLVGYTDFRHFTKVFKKYEGITPNAYREKVLKSDT